MSPLNVTQYKLLLPPKRTNQQKINENKNYFQMIGIDAWRMAIAGSDVRQSVICAKKFGVPIFYNGHTWCLVLAALLLIGCIEPNPGPSVVSSVQLRSFIHFTQTHCSKE